ncbi:hypothetical protein [Streptomyces sp.]|uniref:hypothetical protein n=1 Tax=Streptomyces sp. TaxID=1931 RepID=UPI002D766776|nr:hypothetical protein [Streptomyces sp.]HET6355448.1 hypothetical protein [Streptomyces sp.]
MPALTDLKSKSEHLAERERMLNGARVVSAMAVLGRMALQPALPASPPVEDTPFKAFLRHAGRFSTDLGVCTAINAAYFSGEAKGPADNLAVMGFVAAIGTALDAYVKTNRPDLDGDIDPLDYIICTSVPLLFMYVCDIAYRERIPLAEAFKLVPFNDLPKLKNAIKGIIGDGPSGLPA